MSYYVKRSTFGADGWTRPSWRKANTAECEAIERLLDSGVREQELHWHMTPSPRDCAWHGKRRYHAVRRRAVKAR